MCFLLSLSNAECSSSITELYLFNVKSIAGQWKYHVLDIIKNGDYSNEKIKRMAQEIVSELYEKRYSFLFERRKW